MLTLCKWQMNWPRRNDEPKDTEKYAQKLLSSIGDLYTRYSKDNRSFVSYKTSDLRLYFQEAKREAEKMASVFKVLKTTGDILQLPKEMLMDKSLRREVPSCKKSPPSPHWKNKWS